MESKRSQPESFAIGQMIGNLHRAAPVDISSTADKVSEVLDVDNKKACAQQHGMVNREMVEMLFCSFHEQVPMIHQKVESLMANRTKPLDAIFLSIHEILEHNAEELIAVNPAFQELFERYSKMLKSRVSPEVVRSLKNFLSTIDHGIGVMIGMYEVLPDGFREWMGRRPTKEELQAMIPSAVQPLMRTLTTAPADAALDVERAMGIGPCVLPYKDGKIYRKTFDPTKITLRYNPEGFVLDLTNESISNALLQSTSIVKKTKYFHGCIAGAAKLQGTESEKDPSVLSYVNKLIVELMEEHWYPTVTQKS